MPPAASIRTRLLDSALECFAEGGPITATLDEVRAGAGASVGAIYHHFPDKGALLDAVRERALGSYQEAFAAVLEHHPGAKEGVCAIVVFHFGWCAANRPAALLLIEGRPPAAESLNRDFFAAIKAWWGVHEHYGAVRELDLLLLHALWLGPAMELTRHWLAGEIPKPSKHQIDSLAAAAWDSLRAVDR